MRVINGAPVSQLYDPCGIPDYFRPNVERPERPVPEPVSDGKFVNIISTTIIVGLFIYMVAAMIIES